MTTIQDIIALRFLEKTLEVALKDFEVNVLTAFDKYASTIESSLEKCASIKVGVWCKPSLISQYQKYMLELLAIELKFSNLYKSIVRYINIANTFNTYPEITNQKIVEIVNADCPKIKELEELISALDKKDKTKNINVTIEELKTVKKVHEKIQFDIDRIEQVFEPIKNFCAENPKTIHNGMECFHIEPMQQSQCLRALYEFRNGETEYLSDRNIRKKYKFSHNFNVIYSNGIFMLTVFKKN
jgi:hypothetical protein